MSKGATKAIYLCPQCNGLSQLKAEGVAVCGTCHHRYEVLSQVPVRKAPEPRQVVMKRKATRGAIERDIVMKRRASDPVDFASIEATTELLNQPALAPDQPNREKRKRLKKRSSTLMRDLSYGGLVAVVMTTAITLYLFVKNHLQEKAEQGYKIEDEMTGEQRRFYFAESESIRKSFESFLRSSVTEGKAMYVVKVGRVPGIMGGYYQQNPMPLLNSALEKSPLFWNLAYKESPSFVEAVWRDAGDRRFETVFLKTNEGWQLDWEQSVRYSTENWTYFLQRFGNATEGEFRLYVGLAAGAGAGKSSRILVRFYPAEEDDKLREAEASPIIDVSLESDMGILLYNMLSEDRKLVEDGESNLASLDPIGLKRVRVRLRWVENREKNQSELLLEEILADNWRGDYSKFKTSEQSVTRNAKQ